MLRQLDVANHYQVLLRFYYDKLNIKQHRKQICRKRHDLVHDQGCGRLYCGICTQSSTASPESIEAVTRKLFKRGLIYCPSFHSDSLEADLQEVRCENARSMSAPFLPRCVQRPGIGQTSLSGQPLDLWPLWQIFLPRTLSGYAHGQQTFSSPS